MSGSPFLKATAQRIGDLMTRACPEVRGPGLLVALSGGPDSVALLLAAIHWAQQNQAALEVAHLNHRLRGDASLADAEFCRTLCLQHDLKFHLKATDPRPVARRRKMGTEEAGRHLRREFFEQILKENDHLHCVAKGHHRDDQSETVIMRFFRGTGPRGLAGIQPVAPPYIHPLLECGRQEILNFLSETRQPWRSDASNLEGDNTRARLRRELIPLAKELFGTGCEQAPARLAELMALEQEFLDHLAEDHLHHISDEKAQLNIPALLDLPLAMGQRVIRHWLASPTGGALPGIEFAHVMNILIWLREGQSGTGLDLPDGQRLVRQFEWLAIQRSNSPIGPEPMAADYRIVVQAVDGVEDPVALGLEQGSGQLDTKGHWNLSCPSDVLQGNLRIRNLQAGDRFQPFGLDGSRKLSDLLRELRVPEAQRPGVLLVEDDGGILWVVGLARSDRTRMLPDSPRIVTISVVKR